jgi:hypothetical protein
LKTTKPAKPVATRPLTAAEKRRWHEEWVDKVVLPGIAGLTGRQQDVARKILLKKRDMKLAGSAARKWDADRKLELLTDYELLLKDGFKAAQAHSVMQDAAGTSKVREYLRDARKLFPRKKAKKS